VEDLDATLSAIDTIFAPASRSKAYGHAESTEGRSFRIGLGGMEIEYCQPVSTSGPVAAHLREQGPGIATIVFGCPRPRTRLARHADWQLYDDAAYAIVTGVGSPQVQAVALSRELMGFDVALEPLETRLRAVAPQP
jgi:hypothetical protein